MRQGKVLSAEHLAADNDNGRANSFLLHAAETARTARHRNKASRPSWPQASSPLWPFPADSYLASGTRNRSQPALRVPTARYCTLGHAMQAALTSPCLPPPIPLASGTSLSQIPPEQGTRNSTTPKLSRPTRSTRRCPSTQRMSRKGPTRSLAPPTPTSPHHTAPLATA